MSTTNDENFDHIRSYIERFGFIERGDLRYSVLALAALALTVRNFHLDRSCHRCSRVYRYRRSNA